MWLGAGRITHATLHKPLMPPAMVSYPAPPEAGQSQGILGRRGAGSRCQTPFSVTAPRESYAGRSQAAMFGEASLLNGVLGAQL